MKKEFSPLLLPLVNGPQWFRDFSKATYEAAFEEYCEMYRSVIAEALGQMTPEMLADTVYGELKAYWGSKRWGRKAAMEDGRLLATLYLSPMLLEMGEEAAAFATALQQRWAEGGTPYTICDKETICKGFSARFCGFPLKAQGDGLALFGKQ